MPRKTRTRQLIVVARWSDSHFAVYLSRAECQIWAACRRTRLWNRAWTIDDFPHHDPHRAI